jgi:hypothetical protein
VAFIDLTLLADLDEAVIAESFFRCTGTLTAGSILILVTTMAPEELLNGGAKLVYSLNVITQDEFVADPNILIYEVL